MDSFEFNKLIGALLGTVFIVFSVGIISDSIFAAPVPEKPGFAIEAVEPAEGSGGEAAPAAVPIAQLLASADPTAGAAVFKKCQACHSGEKGGPNKVGPDLWDIVDRPVAAHAGFAYSAGMKEFSKGGTEKWTYDHLNDFLTSPKGLVKGTAMGFAGIKKDDERANLIAYLRTLADSPVPLPAAEPEAENASTPADASAPAAPAAEAAPAEAAPAEAAPAGEAAPAESAPAEAAPAEAAPAEAAPAETAPAEPAPAQ